jgi:RNA methyltransferase, TrmH family
VHLPPTVTSASNAAVKAARKLVRGPRRADERFLVEGPQAVREAVEHLERLFVTEAAAARDPRLVAAVAEAGAAITPVADEVLASLAETVTPQGLVGVARLEAAALDTVLDAAVAAQVRTAGPRGAGLVVVLWEVRDPGNAGAIIRTADAAGAAGVVLAGDSVDPRNGKAVRASVGSLFHLPIAETRSFAEVVAGCRGRGLALVAADASGDRLHTELDLAGPTALVFGNEARGLDARVLGECDAVARVPILGRAESLNLAATVAVMVYEAARQREVADARGRIGGAA